MRTPLRNFARAHKAAAGYLDPATNAHGVEKGFLAAQLARDPNESGTVHLTLIEAPGCGVALMKMQYTWVRQLVTQLDQGGDSAFSMR